MGAAPRRNVVGSTLPHCKQEPEKSVQASARPAPFCSPNVATSPCYSAVLRSLEAVRDASETPARLHLPAARALAEGASLHPDPADLPRPALGHQGVPGCHCLSHDGKRRCFSVGRLQQDVALSLASLHLPFFFS